jgi:hypothetical protein
MGGNPQILAFGTASAPKITAIVETSFPERNSSIRWLIRRAERKYVMAVNFIRVFGLCAPRRQPFG